MSPAPQHRTLRPTACVTRAALFSLGLLLASAQGWAAERGLGRLVPKTPPTGALLFVGVATDAASQALVQRDKQQAQAIAQALGLNPPRLISLLGKDATAPRIDAALAELRNNAQGQGTVLVYLSGNGTRARPKDALPASPAGCQSGFMLGDGSIWWGSTLRQQMRDLSGQVDDVLLVVDAGFAPTPKPGEAWVSRFTPGPASSPPCEAGKLFEGVAASAQRGLGRRERWVAFHAADTALGNTNSGGLIGTALQECLNGAVEDSDHSGGIAARELAACARPVLQRLARSQASAPAVSSPGIPDILVAGEAAAVLAFRADTLPGKPTASGASPAGSAPPAPAQPTAALSDPVPPGGPRATLMDMFASRDARVELSLALTKPRLKIGEDLLSLTVASSHAGYLYILMAGSDGQQFDLLFPNQLDQDNRIGPQTRLTLPRPDWEVVAGGPPGSSTLLAIVSPETRDFSALVARQTGPFSVLDGRQGSPLQRIVAEAGSTGSSQRGLRRSPVGYGAAWVEVQEY